MQDSSRVEEFRVGTDVGGTFTDIVFAGSIGTILTHKSLSTPQDYSCAVVEGISRVLIKEGIDASSISEVVHGTTIVTNTCIEQTGARVALITTKGFRDVLEIGRGRMPELYNLAWKKPAPLVPRYLRFEVDERIGKHGEIIRPVNEDELDPILEEIRANGVGSVAICLYNSPRNSVHEERIEALLHEREPDLLVTRSTRIRPVLKEYERTSEAVVNAYVAPVVSRYLRSLRRGLDSIGVRAPLRVMQSGGGMITAEEAAEMPVEIVECGPAAGVVGAAYLADQQRIENIITLDLGGTTTKASIVESGRYTRSAEYEVGAGIHRASRMHKGKGYVLRIPSIDIAEIGAGGGSIAWIDPGGLINVGPRSAGASPGPVCYNRGGVQPTLTDSYVNLGYMNPESLLSGEFPLDYGKARAAYQRDIAGPLDLEVLQAAYAVYLIANSNIMRAIRSVSSERGRDPRRFSLFVFGGAGALHGAAVAASLGIGRVIVPPIGGAFSAFGLLCADVERNRVRTFDRLLEGPALEDMNRTLALMAEELLRATGDSFDTASAEVQRYADIRYKNQASELTIALPRCELGEEHLQLLARDFNREYQKDFGYHFDRLPLEVVNLRVTRTTRISKPQLRAPARRSGVTVRKPAQTRKAYFGPEQGTREAPVLSMEEVGETGREGPVLIDTYDTTIVVPPGCSVRKSLEGSLVIGVGDGRSAE
ncbi:MAG: hydantoinase/oxoprolinase family protein [Acidobacteriota bacterium]